MQLALVTKTVFSLNSPRRLFDFKDIRCGAYWRTTLKRGRCLFQRKYSYSYEISELWGRGWGRRFAYFDLTVANEVMRCIIQY